jgi:long-chain acyl-CoA synthetase
MSILGNRIEAVVQLDPSADAVEAAGHWYSWAALRNQLDALEDACVSLGLGPDARVGVMLRNRIGPYAALVFCLARRRCLVTLNPAYPADVLAQDIRALRLPVVIGEAADLAGQPVAAALAQTGTASIVLGATYEDAIQVVRPAGNSVSIRTNSASIIEMLTSGTTGTPKRVAIGRRGFEEVVAKGIEGPPRLSDNVQILNGPFAHIGGIWHVVNQLVGGRKACMLEKFTVGAWHAAVLKHRPKSSATPPAALRMILDANIPKDDLSSLVVLTSGTAPLDWAVVDTVWERYGIPVLTNYGATESSGAAIAGWSLKQFQQHRDAKRGSVGKIQPGVEARVVSPESGVILPIGEQGLLEVRGNQMATVAGTWMRTTDIVVLDADNFLWIKGRADQAILRGGFKVHPDDVARAIETHPAVKEAAVVGLSDARLGQVPHAAIVLKPGALAPTQDDWSAFLRRNLTAYQVPVAFHLFEAIPRTTSLKPALAALRSQIAQRLQVD